MFDVSGANQTNGVDLNMFQGLQGWDVPAVGPPPPTNTGNSDGGGGMAVLSQQATGGLQNGGFVNGLDDESWMILNDPAVLNGDHSWDAGVGPGVG